MNPHSISPIKERQKYYPKQIIGRSKEYIYIYIQLFDVISLFQDSQIVYKFNNPPHVW